MQKSRRLLSFLSLIIFIFSGNESVAQKQVVDSLNTALKTVKQDTTRLRIYLELGDACEREDNLRYAEPALKLADKLLQQTTDTTERKKYFDAKAAAYNLMIVFYSSGPDADANMEKEYIDKAIDLYRAANESVNTVEAIIGSARYYLARGNFPVALEYLQKGIATGKELNYAKGMAMSYAQMGDIYRDEGESTQALENYQQALSILNETKDTSALVNVLAAMGGFYYKTHNIPKSLEYYHRVISIYEAKKWNDRIALVYKWIGDLYRDNNDYSNSLANYERSLKMQQALGNKPKMEEVLDQIGTIYYLRNNSTKAIEYHNKSLAIAVELSSKLGMAWSHYYLARAYQQQKNYKKANQYCILALEVIKEDFDAKDIRDAELLASQIDSANGNSKGAYEHYKQYVALSNQLSGEAVHKAAQHEKFQNEFNKQQAEQEKKDAVAHEELKKQKLVRNGFVGGFSVVLLFAGIFFTQRNRIKKGKKLSDELLLNILPGEVAEELKANGSAEAKQFDEVTVMFTDFKGFTQISEKLSPAELVAEIHYCFKTFDSIITRHTIEKIKTIGDSYMCAGGLPVANTTHATDVVNAALEIQQFMQEHKIQRQNEGKEIFEIRIGIHTGPVVAGIVGIKKFAYDIWGDTVNIASRMESSGEAGKVNISGSTFELVKDKFTCTHRGKIAAKNKGETDMFFVDRS